MACAPLGRASFLPAAGGWWLLPYDKTAPLSDVGTGPRWGAFDRSQVRPRGASRATLALPASRQRGFLTPSGTLTSRVPARAKFRKNRLSIINRAREEVHPTGSIRLQNEIPGSQWGRPGGLVLASWLTASMIRRHNRCTVVVLLGEQLIGARGAFLERFLAVALKHQGRRPPDVDFGDHSPRLSPIRKRSREKDVTKACSRSHLRDSPNTARPSRLGEKRPSMATQFCNAGNRS